MIIRTVVVLFFSYLLGSIPFSYLAGRLQGRLDLSNKGSGNLGGTNAVRVLGWRLGVSAGLADISKGVVAAWMADSIVGARLAPLAILVVTVGHNWSLFFGCQKGGKGISTTIGGFLYLSPIITLLSVGVALEIVILSRLVSLGSLVLVTLIPLGLLLTKAAPSSVVISLILMAMAFWRHQENIQRLAVGNERQLGQRE